MLEATRVDCSEDIEHVLGILALLVGAQMLSIMLKRPAVFSATSANLTGRHPEGLFEVNRDPG